MATAMVLAVMGTALPAAGVVAPVEVQSPSGSKVVYPEYAGQAQPFPIQFYLTRSSNVTVAAHDPSGAVVTTIYDERSLPAGWQSMQWRLEDGAGNPLDPGVYSIVITAIDSEGGTATSTIEVVVQAGGPPPLKGLTPGATVSGDVDLSVTPPADLDVLQAYFQADGCATAQAPQPVDGTYSATMSFDSCPQGPSDARGYFLVRDRFGAQTWLSTNPVRVTIADTVGPAFAWTSFVELLSLAQPDAYESASFGGYLSDASGIESATVTIATAGGEQVLTAPMSLGWYGWAGVSWAGTDADGYQLPEGLYVLTARVTDRAGNTTEVSREVTLDAFERAQLSLLPEDGGGERLRALVAPWDPSKVNSVSVSVGNHGEIAANWDDEWEHWVALIDTADYPTGSTEVRGVVRWTDSKGSYHEYRTDPWPVTFTDDRGPALTPYSLPTEMALATPTSYNSAFFSLYYTDRSGLGGSTMTVRDETGTTVRSGMPGGSSWSYYSGPYAYWYWDGLDDAGNALPSGTYTVDMTVRDSSGNSTTYEHTVRLDSEEPVQWTLEPVEGSDTAERAVITVADGITPYEVRLQLQDRGSVAATWDAEANAWVGELDRTAYESGEADVRVVMSWTRDGSYYTFTSSAKQMTFADTVAPSLSFVPSVKRLSLTSPSTYESIQVTAGVSDAGGIDRVDFTVLDGTGDVVRAPEAMGRYYWNNETYYGYWAGTDATGELLPAGEYTLRVRATDKAGNQSTQLATIELVRIVPGALVAPVEGGRVVGTAAFRFEPSPDLPGDISQVAFYVGGQSFSIHNASPDGVWRTTYPAGQLPAGQHTVTTYVYWTDEAGIGRSFSLAPRQITVDPTAIPLEVSLDRTEGTAPVDVTASITTSHPTGDAVSVAINWGDGSPVERVTVTAPYAAVTRTHTYAVAGSHEVVVTASGGTGTVSTVTRSLAVAEPPNELPTVNGTPSATRLLVDEPVRLALSGDDPEGKPLTYKVSWGDGSTPASGTVTDDLVVEHAWARSGTYLVRYQVTDGVHTVSRSLSVRVALPGPLTAVPGDAQRVVVGQTVTLDAAASSPSGLIDGFEWQLGDGTTRSGQRIEHVFTSRGTYDVKLTVRSGQETASTTTTIEVLPVPVEPGLQVTVGNGSALLSGATVSVMPPDGARITQVTDGAGRATMHGLQDGEVAVTVYAQGYLPAVATATLAGGGGDLSVTLTKGEVGAAVLETDRLTVEEVEERGIDVSAAENQNVYEAQIQLHFVAPSAGGDGEPEPSTEVITIITWPSGGVVTCGDSCGTSTGPGDPITLGGSTFIPRIEHVEGVPIVEWLVIPVRASWLKEFFDVSLIVQNLGTGVTFTDGEATLDLPPGLALATTAEPQSLTRSVPDVAGGGEERVTWTVRGDLEGEYDLSASYSAVIDPVDADLRLEAGTSDPIKVWGGSALRMGVVVDPDADRWAPYRMRVSLTNTTPVATGPTIYNLVLEALNRPVDAPDAQARYHFSPVTPRSAKTAALAPGQDLVLDVIVYPGIGSDLDVAAGEALPEDYVTHMLTDLTQSAVVRTGGNVDILVETRCADGTTKPICTAESSTPRLDLRASVPTPDTLHLDWDAAGGDVATYEVYTMDSLDDGGWRSVKTVPDGQLSVDLASTTPGLGAYFTVVTVRPDGSTQAFYPLVAGPAKYAALGDSYSSGEGVPDFEPGTDTDREDAAGATSPAELWSQLTGDDERHNACHRSARGSYSQVLAQDPEMRRALQPALFAACSGAVTKDLVEANIKNDDEPAQLDKLNGFTRVVTLTMGGNDVGFDKLAKTCLIPIEEACTGAVGASKLFGSQSFIEESFLERTKLTYDVLDAGTGVAEDCAKITTGVGIISCVLAIRDAHDAFVALKDFDPDRVAWPSLAYGDELRTRLVTRLTDAARRAPNASIVVAGYPRLFEADATQSCPVAILGSGVGPEASAAVNGFVSQLNGEIYSAVTEANRQLVTERISFVDVQDDFAGKELCKDGTHNPDMAFHPVINEFLSWPQAFDSTAFSFHPNASGHRLYAEAFKSALAGHRHAVLELGSQPVDGPTTTLRGGTASITGRARAAGTPVVVELVDPSGRTYGQGSAGVTAGTADGVSWITISNPAGGDWTLRVSPAATGARQARAFSVTASAGARTTVDAELFATTVEALPVARGSVSGDGAGWRFDATASTAPTTADLRYQWLFPDGDVADGAVVTRTFADGVEPAAILTVTTPGGASATADVNRVGPLLPLLRPLGLPEIQAPEEVTVGTELRATTVEFSPAADTVTRRWLRDGEPISGATASAYTVTSADVGHELSVVVSGTATGHRATSMTSGTITPTALPTAPPTLPTTPTPTPTPTPTATPSPTTAPTTVPSPTPSPSPTTPAPTSLAPAKITVKTKPSRPAPGTRARLLIRVRSAIQVTGRITVAGKFGKRTLRLRSGRATWISPILRQKKTRLTITYAGSSTVARTVLRYNLRTR